MARIKARAQVHLPYDVNGVSALPGQVIEVETDHPQIIGYLEGGLLVALGPLEFPGDLQPPREVSPDDAAATRAANAADGEPEFAVEPQAAIGEPGSVLGRDGMPLKDAGDPIPPADLEAQAEAEKASSGDPSADAPTGADAPEAPEEPKTTPQRGKK